MVLIITLNYNQNEFTTNCVHSILSSNHEDFKILLIDNGSTQENYQNLKESIPHNDKLMIKRIEKNIGYVGGINYGLNEGSKMKPNYFLIMNNDTILDEDAISELVDMSVKFQNKAIVTGKVYHFDKPNVIQDIGYFYSNRNTLQFRRIGLNEVDNGQFDTISERDMIDDIFWLFPVKLYRLIGGYSPYFWFNAEQADFALRAKREGFKLVFTPMAKLWHKGSVSIGGRDRNPRLAYWHIQSSLILGFIHLNYFNFFLFFMKTFKSILITSFKALLYTFSKNSSLNKYAKAKVLGLIYFIKWVFLRNENTGECPY